MCCFVAVVPTYPILTQCCSRVTVLRGVCEVHYVWTEQHLLHGFAHYFPLNACLCLFSDLVSLVTDGLVSCLCVGPGDVAVGTFSRLATCAGHREVQRRPAAGAVRVSAAEANQEELPA